MIGGITPRPARETYGGKLYPQMVQFSGSRAICFIRSPMLRASSLVMMQMEIFIFAHA
jgi:hypothetical protein